MSSYLNFKELNIVDKCKIYTWMKGKKIANNGKKYPHVTWIDSSDNRYNKSALIDWEYAHEYIKIVKKIKDIHKYLTKNEYYGFSHYIIHIDDEFYYNLFPHLRQLEIDKAYAIAKKNNDFKLFQERRNEELAQQANYERDNFVDVDDFFKENLVNFFKQNNMWFIDNGYTRSNSIRYYEYIAHIIQQNEQEENNYKIGLNKDKINYIEKCDNSEALAEWFKNWVYNDRPKYISNKILNNTNLCEDVCDIISEYLHIVIEPKPLTKKNQNFEDELKYFIFNKLYDNHEWY